MEVDHRGEVGDDADGIDVDATIVLYEVGALRLYEEADVVVVFLLTVAQGEAQVVGVVLILGESAEAPVEEVVE